MSKYLKTLTEPPKDGKEFIAVRPFVTSAGMTHHRYRYNLDEGIFELYNFGWSSLSCKNEEFPLIDKNSLFIVYDKSED